MTDESILAVECRGDFYLKLEQAMDQCGGSIPLEKLSESKLSDIVDCLAQNGIRMVYKKEWHIQPEIAP